jgi:hypothetical protein
MRQLTRMELQDLAPDTALVMQPTKSTQRSQTFSQAVALSDELVSKLAMNGVIAAGCPGEARFFSEHANQSTTKVESLVHTLMELHLPAQGMLLRLRKV